MDGNGKNDKSRSWSSQLRSLARGDTRSSLSHHSPPDNDDMSLVAQNIQGLNGINGMQALQHMKFPQSMPPVSIDLDGGTLIDISQEDEIDASDGCRVEVTTYRYMSADGTEECTKKIRRKFKMEATQTSRTMEIVNGLPQKMEEKVQRLHGDIKGVRPMEQLTNNQLVLNSDDPQDVAISNVLRQTQDNFYSMLSKEKDALVKMFPDLFSQMRSESSLIPSTNTEIIQNPDGTTTTRVSSSKSYSSHFSKRETYVNGVKQKSKSKFRAFVECRGPEGGFRVKLADGDDELSEEDEDENDENVSRTYSEIPDDESGLIQQGTMPRVKSELKKRHDKAWHAAKELVDSEQRYVDKLRLLSEMFRERVQREGALNEEKKNSLFSNIKSIHDFHNTHLLPQLLDASREWSSTRRMSHIVRKQAPFLKMYSEYTNNYKRACKVYEEAVAKKKKFAQIVQEIEALPECENLPLVSHLICPVQRVMRYQLLLQEYKKHLVPSDADYADTEAALELVLEAAAHANEMMRKLDRYGKVIEVQEQLGNALSLVSPGRELLKEGAIQKISSATLKNEERHLFVFNDIFLLASDRSLGFGKYKLRAIFHACHSQVCEGDNLEREHSFYIRGSDGSGPQRCVELFCDSQKEKAEWVDQLCSAIEEANANSASFSNQAHRNSGSDQKWEHAKNCADCDSELGSILNRGSKCTRCRRKLCKKCFGRYHGEAKAARFCECCVKNQSADMRRSPEARKNALAVPAKEGSILHSSHVKFRGSLNRPLERYFVVRSDFCLYSYISPNDDCAQAMLPLPGCEVKLSGERNTFSVKLGSRRLYQITAEDEQSQARWMAILDLAANAQLQ